MSTARLNTNYSRTATCPIHRCRIINRVCVACQAEQEARRRGLPVSMADEPEDRVRDWVRREAHKAIAEGT